MSFEVGNTILRLKPHDQGRSQHGARGQLPPPPPRFQCVPPDGFCSDHGRSLAMKQLPLKITITPISLTSHIMQISQFVQQQIYFIKIVCKLCTILDLLYCNIYLLTGRSVLGRARAPLPSQGPRGHQGHRNRKPAKCFDT